MRVLILGASYGSLLATKLAMAGHDVTLVCTRQEVDLINAEGTIVRIKLRGEDEHRVFRSSHLQGHVDAAVPAEAKPETYDIIALAMQEPQYSAPEVRDLLARIGASGKPIISIMNMPPLPYLLRIPGIKQNTIEAAFVDPSVWAPMSPDLITLCSPDPQAFRPPEEALNVLHVGLPTNFKAAAFANPGHTEVLRKLESDIAEIRIDGKDVPVKVRVHDSLFVPLAKWPMLMTGNYRAVTATGARSIRDAVHSDIVMSRHIYEWVEGVIVALGGNREDMVPFSKYALAAESLLKPSSVARALEAGVLSVERVDKLVKILAASLGRVNPEINEIVSTVEMRLQRNRDAAA